MQSFLWLEAIFFSAKINNNINKRDQGSDKTNSQKCTLQKNLEKY